MHVNCLAQRLVSVPYPINGTHCIQIVGLHTDFFFVAVDVNDTGSFISTYLLSIYDVPDAALCIGVPATSKTDPNPRAHSAFLLTEGERH